MTNAEAIETLRANYPDACYEQLRCAVDAAIEALEAQDRQAIIAGSYLLEGEDNVPDTNVGDTIYRQDAIELAMQYCPDDDGTCSKADEDIRNLLDELEALPPAHPGSKELSLTQKTLDTISRQAAIETAAEYEIQLREILGDENELVEVVKILKHRLLALPSAQPEPCDAISRADAIRVASGYCHPANVAQELAKLPSVQPEPHYTDDQIQKMQDLEQAQLDKAFELGRKDAKWIPCSERLPEKYGWYLCTLKDTRVDTIYWNNKGEWLDNGKKHFFELYNISSRYTGENITAEQEGSVYWTDWVIAWMPLPEAYREEGE